MSKYISGILSLYLFFSISSWAQVRILTIGDSTMANYDEQKNSGEKEIRGWAQMLPLFLTEGAIVENAAKNGRSSKSFYYQYWPALRETLKSGDYVFIQFGHNDEKADGQDTDESDLTQRGTAAWGQYQKYLGLYVNESRERGAIPILLTPVVRRLFDEQNKEIIGKGLHNLTDIALNDSTMNYPLAMRSLARNLNVPLVDLTALTQNFVEAMRAENAKKIIYANDDNTHLKAMGGILFSELVVGDLLKKNILTDYLVLSVPLLLKADTENFGLQFVGKDAVKVFTLFGTDMKPESGSIKLQIQEPFSIAASIDGEYGETLDISYFDKCIYKPVYVRFCPKEPRNYQGQITLKGNDISQNIALKGTTISQEGGLSFAIKWNTIEKELPKDNNIKISVRTEGLTLINKDGKLLYQPESGLWPAGDIDVNSSRYLEIAFTPTQNDAYIDSLVFNLSSIGGKGMSFTALGSIDESFLESYTFALMESLQENKLRSYHSDRIIAVPEGKTFYIRIYPWYRNEATGKYLDVESIFLSGLLVQKNK